MKLKIKYFEGATKLKKISVGNWIDVYANESIFVPQGKRAMIPLGFALELPKGWEGHLAPRSSTFKTWGVIQTNSVGIVDDTYVGDNDQWMMPVYCLEGKHIETDYGILSEIKVVKDGVFKLIDGNGDVFCVKAESINGQKGTLIRKGDKIAQFRIMEVMPEIKFEEVESFGNEDRGSFGTTGTR